MAEAQILAVLVQVQGQLSDIKTELSDIKKEQQQQQEQLSDIKKEQQQQQEQLSDIKKEQQQQQEQLSDIKKEQQQQQDQLSDIKTELSDIKKEQQQQHLALYSRIGVVFEIAVRREITKLKGEGFSPSFSITNLYGFARLLRKKETFSHEQQNTTARQHNDDVKKLHNFFYKNRLYDALFNNILEHAREYYGIVPKPQQGESFEERACVLRELNNALLKAKQPSSSSSPSSLSPSSSSPSSSSSSSSSPSSSPSLSIPSTQTSLKDPLFRAGVADTLLFFEQQARIQPLPKSDHKEGLKRQQEALVSNGFVGFMGFTAAIRHNKLPFHRFLEIDCRGSVSEFLNIITFEVGEIKSGNDLQKARDQLHYRLSLLFSGARIIHTDPQIQTRGTGFAFFPQTAQLPTLPEQMEIPSPFDPSVVSQAKLSVVKI